ncbi:DNA-processing protein DprA [uncultured Ilyobacter sp.]|uniref:DNA-processing protein DprA n=1 Tax=uncultured Ilyobacter sp. TaxID=544433 RepID=UPI0029F52901|nr:DNA-processing protein DprA [uncultured Ilyobacter sp.]
MEWYRLRVAGVKDSLIRKFMKNFDSYKDILKLDGSQLERYYGLNSEEVKLIMNSYNMDDELEKEMEILEKNRIRIMSLPDSGYPIYLKNIASPPVFLYVKGKGEFSDKSIGVVGTRKMTAYGQTACERITMDLVDAGVTTVSGLALGIDGVCHRKTLEKNGNSIAVVGNGLDIVYPQENRKIWERMEREGTIISEFPLGTRPIHYNFPLRNRIIAGLSKGVVIVESMSKGGSLITAGLALEEGRDVFAVPGDVFSPSSEGCNDLIKKSEAKLIVSGMDILKEYGWDGENKNISQRVCENLKEKEEIVFNVLKKEMNLDELIMSTGIRAGELLALLMELELKGLICGAPGGKYRRKVV